MSEPRQPSDPHTVDPQHLPDAPVPWTQPDDGTTMDEAGLPKPSDPIGGTPADETRAKDEPRERRPT
jgi:hypothetical protein